jgi:hypothetical protein
MCVTVTCCYITVGYRVTFMCVRYCNVLLQYSWYRFTVMCACYCKVLLQYSWVQCNCYVGVTVICCYNTVGYRVIFVCVLL